MVREGYKQTEVGIIPEDWEISSVGKEFKIQLGKMLDAAKNTGILKPYIGNRAVQWGRFDINNLPLMAMSRSDMERFCLKAGDLIVCEGGEVGRAAIWDAPIEECYYQKALHRLRVLRDFSPQLMMAFLKYWTDFDLLSNYVSQTSIAHLTKEKLAQVPLPVPSVEEQTIIAQALSDVDALITALDELIVKKRNLKTATMQQLLTGKKRLPGFGEGQGYKQTEVGVIPEDWDVSAVGNICDFIVPGRNKPKIFKGNIPWITTPDLEDGRSVFTSKLGLFVSRDEAKSVGSKIVPSGAVIMSCVGELGIVAFVEREIVINQQLHAFIPSQIIDSIFLLNALQAQKDFMLSIATQTAVPYLNKDNCNSIPIPLPSCLEQLAIATVLSDMDAEIAALESRLAKTQAIKQGMMQELLTGRTRLV